MNNPRYGGQWNDWPLSVSVVVLLFMCAMLPLHAYAAIVRVGHPVNDACLCCGVAVSQHQQLSDQAPSALIPSKLVALYQHSPTQFIAQQLKTHTRPCVYFIHLMTAFALLIPNPLYQAEQLRNEAVEADILHPFESHGGLLSTLSGDFSTLSLTTINYFWAVGLFSIHYPAPFWQCQRSFSALYSLVCAGSLLQVWVEMQAFHHLHARMSTAQITDDWLLSPHQPLLLSSWWCGGLLLASFLSLLCMLLMLFECGQLNALRCHSQHCQVLHHSTSSKICIQQSLILTSARDQCLADHWCVVAGFSCFWLFLSCKVFCFVEYMQCWRTGGGDDGDRHKGRPVLFLYALVLTVLLLLLLFAVWFCICVKKDWHLKSRSNSSGSTARAFSSCNVGDPVTAVPLLMNDCSTFQLLHPHAPPPQHYASSMSALLRCHSDEARDGGSSSSVLFNYDLPNPLTAASSWLLKSPGCGDSYDSPDNCGIGGSASHMRAFYPDLVSTSQLTGAQLHTPAMSMLCSQV